MCSRIMLMDKLGSGAIGLGFISTAIGIGLIVGSFLVGNYNINYRVRFIFIAWFFEGILLIFMGISPSLWFALFIAFLTGMATGGINVPTESLIQLNGKNNTGKVFSYWMMTIWIGQLISLVTIVPLFNILSFEKVFGLSGMVLSVLALIALFNSWHVADTEFSRSV